MGKLFRVSALLTVLIIMFSLVVYGEGVYTEPTREFFVNDFANVLSQGTEDKVLSLGKQLEEKTSVQVVLVTVDSLDGKDIKTYSIELATKWAIGQKGKDNGILILNAVKDRNIRIEVGYGIEGTIGAINANQIIRNFITPHLKNGDYDTGLLSGYSAVIEEVAKESGISIDNTYSQSQPRQNRTKSLPFGMGGNKTKFAPFLLIALLILDGVFFRFRITSTLIKIVFWSNIFRGGRGGWGGGGFGGGGSYGGGGSSGGGGSFGGGGSDEKY